MNKNIAEIIDALTAHEDTSSIQVLEELGTNSPDNEIREYTSRALVKKNLHDSLKVVIINQGIKILDDTINMHSDEAVKENARSVKSLLALS